MRRRNAYLTPASIPDGAICRPVFIPDSPEWLAAVSGALAELTNPYSWEQSGAVTPQEAAERMTLMLSQYYAETCGEAEETIPTPYWDDAADLDDEEALDLQTWYGYVTDWAAPIDELNFVQNAAVWAITGFVAYAAGIGAAVTFRTVARNFVIAIQREDVGEAIRVVVNGVQETKIDTTPYSPGEVIEVPISAQNSAAYYDILITGAGIP